MKKKGKILLALLLIFSMALTTGAAKQSTPQTVYRVYLKGESLGIIKSKTELEDYIDKKQDEIKKKYNVKNVDLFL